MFFISQDRKNFAREPFCVSEKYFMDRRGVSRFSVEKFLCDCTKIFHWRQLWSLRKILLSKIYMHRRGTSRFCRSFLSHRTETKIYVQKPFFFPVNSWYRKKIMDKRGQITIFSRNLYASRCRKSSSRNPTVFDKISVSKRICGWKGRVSRFSVENFRCHSNEKNRGHPFNFSEKSGYRKVSCIIKGTTFFRQKILVSQCRKNSWASDNVSDNLSYRKTLGIVGGNTNCRRKTFVSQGQEILWTSR